MIGRTQVDAMGRILHVAPVDAYSNITLMGTVGRKSLRVRVPPLRTNSRGVAELADATVMQNASSLAGGFLNRFNITVG